MKENNQVIDDSVHAGLLVEVPFVGDGSRVIPRAKEVFAENFPEPFAEAYSSHDISVGTNFGGNAGMAVFDERVEVVYPTGDDLDFLNFSFSVVCDLGGREKNGRERGVEGGRRERNTEGGREGGREGEREVEKEEGREGWRTERGREGEEREGGRREGGREGGRKEGRDGGQREGGREVTREEDNQTPTTFPTSKVDPSCMLYWAVVSSSCRIVPPTLTT